MEDLYKSLDHEQLYLLQAYNLIKGDELIKKLAINLEELYPSKLKDLEFNDQLDTISNKLREDFSRIINHSLASDILAKEKLVKVENRKPIRIFIEGVFDIIHSGHFNAIRQAKKLGEILVVGVNSDADVEKAKGPTLMNVHERGALIAACKWVDETVLDTPYTPTITLLEDLHIDYIAHGDDPCFNENGEDVYAEFKKRDMFKMFKRTEGISTTEIIGRLLMLNKDNSRKNSMDEGEVYTTTNLLRKSKGDEIIKGPVVSSFLTTGWRLSEFCNNKVPKISDKIVYIDGDFDILHIGHIETLKKAKEMGDFLYVGVHDDGTINKHRGRNYPILNMQERVFNLLALRYVDDVVIGAPWAIKEDLIKSLRINLVVHGVHTHTDDLLSEDTDPHYIPKKIGIYKEIESPFDLNSEVLVKRLIEKRDNYMKKFQNKTKKEEQYYEKKEYIPEI